MLEDRLLTNYSKSPSNSLLLNDYIKFAFPEGTYSIDDFNTNLEKAVLQKP